MSVCSCKIVSNKKLLACSHNFKLFYKKGVVYYQKHGEDSCHKLDSILTGKKYYFSKIRLLERVFRLEPRCAVAIADGEFLVSCKGGVYFVSIESKTIRLEHQYRPGMNNALNFCVLKNLQGFKDCVLYGEYFGNAAKEAVNIYARYSAEKWEKVFSFSKGKITHIHNIVAHSARGSIIVLTGDKDSESGIYELGGSFEKPDIWACGEQKHRACVAFPYKKGLLYATDTPLENNHIYYLEKNGDAPMVHKKIYAISGPCIYGIEYLGDYFFATSVEPDPRVNKWRYMFTRKLGQGVHDRKSHIYVCRQNESCEEIFSASKDMLPMLLFQFGNFQFPTGMTKRLYVTGQSISKMDGKTMVIEYE